MTTAGSGYDPAWTARVRRVDLPNGCTILAQSFERPASAVVIRIRAGFFDEPDTTVGISHVLEHMIFKGTPTRPGPGTIPKAIRSVGGYVNAATSYDYTSYYSALPAGQWGRGLEVLLDAVRHPLLDPGELERELRVIIEEVKRKRDTPGAVAVERLYRLLHDRHRIRRWRIGDETALARLTREEVAAYHASRYDPERTIVSLVAPGDPERLLERACTLASDWKGSHPEIVSGPAETSPPEPRTETIRGDVTRSNVLLGWRTVPPDHPDHLPLVLVASVLARGRGSWLGQVLRDSGIATGVEAHQYAPTELGVFLVGAECEPDRVEETIGAIRGEVGRLIREGPAAADLDRVRTLTQSRWHSQLGTAEGRSAALAAAEARGGVQTLDEEFERLLTLDDRSIVDAAERWLAEGAMSAVVYHPDRKGTTLAVGFLSGTADSKIGPASAPALVKVPNSMTIPVTRTGALAVASLEGIDLIAARMEHLALATVAVYQHRRQSDPQDMEGLGALAVRAAVRGAGEFDGRMLATAFESLGGSVQPAIGPEYFGFSTTTLASKALVAGALLRTVWEEACPDAAEIAKERRLVATDAERLSDDMYRYPQQLAAEARFPGHPYGRRLLGTRASVEAITTEAVQRWYVRERRGRPVAVVVADQDPSRLLEGLAGVFAGVGGAEDGDADESVPGRPGRVEVERDRAQTAICMLFPGPDRRSEDRFAAEIWAAWSGGLGGRLFSALRDQRSLAYSVSADHWVRTHAGGLMTYIATSPDREEEARQGMLGELERTRREPPSLSEVNDAIAYVVGQDAVARQTPQALAAELLETWLVGVGLGEIEDRPNRLAAVSPEAILELALEYLDPDQRSEGIVRGVVR